MKYFGEILKNNIFDEKNGGILVHIKVVPNAKKNEIVLEEEFLKVRITAQPVENKANKALVEFLSKHFKISKSKISIVKGLTSREKTIFINGITADEFKI